jgi:hypothetical protein
MGFFDFLRGSGKQVELKPEVLKAEISEDQRAWLQRQQLRGAGG